MNQQQKLDEIVLALHNQHLLNPQTSVGLNPTITSEGEKLSLSELRFLGNRLHQEGFVIGLPYKGGYRARLSPKGVELAEELLFQKGTFNIYLRLDNGHTNLYNLSFAQSKEVALAYEKGTRSVSINFINYHFKTIEEIGFFKNQEKISTSDLERLASEKRGAPGHQLFLTVAELQVFGQNVTSKFIKDDVFGYAQHIKQVDHQHLDFIALSRVQELEEVSHQNFDLTKLIRICIELNDNYSRGNYYTTGLLIRSIINHVPPIFGSFTSFAQVIGGYGSQSFKSNMRSLNDALRKTADGYTHELISRKELLPTPQQVDYRGQLDLLLCEVIKVLH